MLSVFVVWFLRIALSNGMASALLCAVWCYNSGYVSPGRNFYVRSGAWFVAGR